MVEMVSSSVFQETVNRVLSGLIDKYEGRSNANEHMERLEMAHIKLEAAVETSERWKINEASLLRWQGKLKRVAQECDETLRKCKQRIVEDEVTEAEAMDSSFPKRIAHSTKQFVSSVFCRNNNELSRPTVRRFEWLADSACDFLRFVEAGGATPRQHMFFDPLIRHLLAGRAVEYKFSWRNQHHLFVLRPFNTDEHGVEGRLLFIHKDGNAPENNFFLCLMLQLSESTDIVGITVRCLQLFAPHLSSTAETAKRKLTQLPTQDFCWLPYVESSHRRHWNNLHTVFSQWFRPNPLCCKHHNEYKQPCAASSPEFSPCSISLEPIIKVYLEGYILPPYGCSGSQGGASFSKDFQYLKLGLLFSPHGISEDSLSADAGSVTEMINGGLYAADITLEQLGEIMLPKAIDCLLNHQNDETTEPNRMCCKSKHGGAYLQVEKTSAQKSAVTRRGRRRSGKNKLSRRQANKNVETWTDVVTELLNSWVAYAPARLQGTITDWIQKHKEMQLA